MNDRITKKERGLIKGALRRVFSRSDLRKQALAAATIEHHDPTRRTKKWCRCDQCGTPTPQWLCDVDHVIPVVPIDRASAEMTADELVNNLWCDPKYLAVLCESCHTIKSTRENKQRRQLKKKGTSNAKPKRAKKTVA